MRQPQHYLLRLVRGGPLVPARIQWLAHEPGVPSNPRDRWPALLEQVDIAGEIRPPEELHERLHWPAGHWKSTQIISKEEYEYRLNMLRWAETNLAEDPILRPHRQIKISEYRLPSFERENNAGQ